jgi:hypothetical protein
MIVAAGKTHKKAPLGNQLAGRVVLADWSGHDALRAVVTRKCVVVTGAEGPYHGGILGGRGFPVSP